MSETDIAPTSGVARLMSDFNRIRPSLIVFVVAVAASIGLIFNVGHPSFASRETDELVTTILWCTFFVCLSVETPHRS